MKPRISYNTSWRTWQMRYFDIKLRAARTIYAPSWEEMMMTLAHGYDRGYVGREINYHRPRFDLGCVEV